MSDEKLKLREIFSTDATSLSDEKIGCALRRTSLSEQSHGSGVAVISKRSSACRASEKLSADRVDAAYLNDRERLSAMELRRRYPGEANSHRNMLDRRDMTGAIVHPAFVKFASFLRHVGPKPTKGASLDRIDNSDPEYAPGKVRWADKRTQNSNKGDSIKRCARFDDRAWRRALERRAGAFERTLQPDEFV